MCAPAPAVTSPAESDLLQCSRCGVRTAEVVTRRIPLRHRQGVWAVECADRAGCDERHAAQVASYDAWAAEKLAAIKAAQAVRA